MTDFEREEVSRLKQWNPPENMPEILVEARMHVAGRTN